MGAIRPGPKSFRPSLVALKDQKALQFSPGSPFFTLVSAKMTEWVAGDRLQSAAFAVS